MKRDNLEKYIQDNRHGFDDGIPDPAVWDRISRELDTENKRIIPWKAYLWRAAAILFIFGMSWFIHDIVDSYNATENDSNPEMAMESLSAEASELLEAELYYTGQIEEMESRVFSLTEGQPDIRAEINMELVELDSVYVELKRDLRDNAANEEILEAMIQNYRLKIAILSDILGQLQGNGKQEDKEVEYEI